MDFKEGQTILKDLERKTKIDKLQIINLINAQYILRFASNP